MSSPPTSQSRAFIGIPEAAEYFDVDHRVIRGLIKSGKLQGYRVGNRIIKVRISDLEAALTPVTPTRPELPPNIAERVRKVVAELPELSDAQVQRITALLSTGGAA